MKKAVLNRSIMAVGAHADDIEGCVGGTLLKYIDRGYGVVYVMATNNMAGQHSTVGVNGSTDVRRLPPEKLMPVRKKEATDGAAFLGTTPVHLDHPNRQYNSSDGAVVDLRYGVGRPGIVPSDVPSILTAHEDENSVRSVVELIVGKNPEYILTHGLDQKDIEHIGTCFLITKAYWRAVEEHGYTGGLLHWRSGIAYLGEANCRWDTFVDISRYLDRKFEALACHKCQIPDPFNPQSPTRLRALAWGTACNCPAAEVFTMVAGSRLVPMCGSQYADFSLEVANNHK